MTIKKNKNLNEHLLRNILFIYWFFALTISSIQVIFVFQNEKKTIKSELKDVLHFFGPRLSEKIHDDKHLGFSYALKNLNSFSIVRKITLKDTDENPMVVFQKKEKANHFFLNGFTFSQTVPLIHKKTISFFSGFMTLSSNGEVIYQRVKSNLIILLLNSLIKSFFLYFVMNFFLKKELKKPIDVLLYEIKNINYDNLSPLQAEIPRKNELHLLKVQFNSLLSKLNEKKLLLMTQTKEIRNRNNELIFSKQELEKKIEDKEERLKQNMNLLREEVNSHKKTEEKLVLAINTKKRVFSQYES